MFKITVIKTSDGRTHATALQAHRHNAKRYEKVITKISEELEMKTQTEIIEYINENLPEFQVLTKIKNDQGMGPSKF